MPFEARHTRNVLAACVVYTALILWGSLYPFTGWRPTADALAFLGVWNTKALSAPDLVVNALIYIPLGIGLRWLTRSWPALLSIALATAFAAALSFGVEAAQAHLPQRVPSLADFILNTGGGLVGATIAALLTPRWRLVARLQAWRARSFQPTRDADLALVAIAGWALSQLSPFVPSLDLGTLRNGLAPLAATLGDPASFDFARMAAYALELFALTLLARDARQRTASLTRFLWLFVLAVLLLKVAVISRQLSAEALAGAAAGLLFGLALPRRLKPARPALAALAMVLALSIGELTPEPGALRQLNWTPFVAHLNNPMLGLSVLIDTFWPYVALAAALHRLSGGGRGITPVIVLVCGGLAFGLEWMQQYVPGRTPDITTVVMALAGAVLAVRHLASAAGEAPRPRSPVRPRLAFTLVAALLLSSASAVWSLARTPSNGTRLGAQQTDAATARGTSTARPARLPPRASAAALPVGRRHRPPARRKPRLHRSARQARQRRQRRSERGHRGGGAGAGNAGRACHRRARRPDEAKLARPRADQADRPGL